MAYIWVQKVYKSPLETCVYYPFAVNTPFISIAFYFISIINDTIDIESYTWSYTKQDTRQSYRCEELSKLLLMVTTTGIYFLLGLEDFTATRPNKKGFSIFSVLILQCRTFAFGAFLVIFFFNVGFLTPYWIEEQETNATNIISNSTNSSTPSPTARTCHHGLFYSLDCPESQNGK